MVYYLTYAVSLDFPFLDELNDILTRFNEGGLTNKWKTDVQKLQREYYAPLNSDSSKGIKAYSMDDLWFAFVFLFSGYGISIFVLIFEFIFKKIIKYNYSLFQSIRYLYVLRYFVDKIK